MGACVIEISDEINIATNMIRNDIPNDFDAGITQRILIAIPSMLVNMNEPGSGANWNCLVINNTSYFTFLFFYND